VICRLAGDAALQPVRPLTAAVGAEAALRPAGVKTTEQPGASHDRAAHIWRSRSTAAMELEAGIERC